MLLELAAARRVLFVGGKGGVGKTTVAAATALSQARNGRRVLLVSTDPAHNLGHLWQRRIGSGIVALAQNLDGSELDPQQTTREHLENVGAALRRLMPEHLWPEVDKHLALSRDAPGMHEAALLERIAELVEKSLDDYDLIVFDTAPSGHTARLIALPEMMSAWTEGLLKRRERSENFGHALRNLGSDEGIGGRILGDRILGDRILGDRILGDRTLGGGRDATAQDRDDRIRQILHRRRHLFEHLRGTLNDAAQTSFVIVLAAERLPVLETIELRAQLRRSGVAVAALVVNKRSPADQGDFLAERHAQEETHLRLLVQSLPDIPLLQLPLLSGDVVGEEALDRFSTLLRQA